MPPLITSRQNGHVRTLRAALRGRAAEGTAAVEGVTLLREAIAVEQSCSGGGLHVETVFLREDRQELATAFDAATPCLILVADVFDSVAATEQSQGVAALLRKPHLPYLPVAGDLLVVAAGLQDPGNMGTLIRSAEALGAAAVLLAEQTVDPWNGKALRASAGSVFRMPIVRWTEALLANLRACEIRLLAAVPNGTAAVKVWDADLQGGCAFLIGNEGNGLSPAMLALADAEIVLHMPGPTESLNAAVAASLLLYEAARQRSVR